ncbi:protein phosphatase CheZ [Advenella alkanexedens]|jgi:chemotaxis protein CheZ|uniref:Protein phosphatase CheZ n=1 Tax=Advenella alkanexedens TaxID=1481665 RepID=A0ABS6NQI4_9BURK|nr:MULTISPECIES: protein phosphatase CheZ [Advenella]MBV4397639.1 protein phosphatase CheZ [Advenella alkanexedens]MDD3759017.1 protein phosphatase CheZ [Advenella sp.]NLN68281.1 protein phosphatase CheZ [Alcaligenaceae bacterium]
MTDSKQALPENGNTVDEAPVYDRIAHVTRLLRDSLRELGLEPSVQAAAKAMPDAQSRIRYITSLTEKAANDVLNSAELAQSQLGHLKASAVSLSEELVQAMQPVEQPQVQLPVELAKNIQAFLSGVKEEIRPVDTALIDIITAQAFQDLTGQVASKLTVLLDRIEQELVQVLIEYMPEKYSQEMDKEAQAENALLNGPVVEHKENGGTVQNQQQVDDLLAQLGF